MINRITIYPANFMRIKVEFVYSLQCLWGAACGQALFIRGAKMRGAPRVRPFDEP